eukprot:COSAG01_NODE_3340_length_6231_cov_2.833007_3_plen_671_part_00
MVLRVRDYLGVGRERTIGFATLSVRHPHLEQKWCDPHTNRVRITRTFDERLTLNGVDTGARIMGVLDIHEETAMAHLSSFSIRANCQQIFCMLITLILCAVLQTLQDFRWRSHEKADRENNLRLHIIYSYSGMALAFALGGCLLDKIGRKFTLLLGWLCGGASVALQLIALQERDAQGYVKASIFRVNQGWLLCGISVSVGVQVGLCTLAMLLAIMDTLGPERKGIACAIHYLTVASAMVLCRVVLDVANFGQTTLETYDRSGRVRVWLQPLSGINGTSNEVQTLDCRTAQDQFTWEFFTCDLQTVSFTISCVCCTVGVLLALCLVKDTQKLQDRETYQRKKAAHDCAETVELENRSSKKGQNDVEDELLGQPDLDGELAVGDAVSWIHSDHDVKPGSVGMVLGFIQQTGRNSTLIADTEMQKVRVQFDQGAWNFHCSELRRVARPSDEAAAAACAAGSNIHWLRPRHQSGPLKLQVATADDEGDDLDTLVTMQEEQFHREQRDISYRRLLYLLQTTDNFRVIWCLALILSFASGLLYALPLRWGLMHATFHTVDHFSRGCDGWNVKNGVLVPDIESQTIAQTNGTYATLYPDSQATNEQDNNWVQIYFSALGLSAVLAGVLSDLHNLRKYHVAAHLCSDLASSGLTPIHYLLATTASDRPDSCLTGTLE